MRVKAAESGAQVWPGAEYAPPGAEFPVSGPALPARKQRRKGQGRRSGGASPLTLAASVVLLVGALLLSGPPAQAPAQDGGTSPSLPAEEPVQTLPTSGTLTITYHNMTATQAEPGGVITRQDTYTLPDFTASPIPEPLPAEGFQFRGWVLYNMADRATKTRVCYRVEGQITAEDVLRVQPGQDGNISVDVYCVWNPIADDGAQLILDDGSGGQQTYFLKGPMLSGSTYFLEQSLPIPERAGAVFDGWYTQPTGGERVYALWDGKFYRQDGQGQPIWNEPAAVTLYAHWK